MTQPVDLLATEPLYLVEARVPAKLAAARQHLGTPEGRDDPVTAIYCDRIGVLLAEVARLQGRGGEPLSAEAEAQIRQEVLIYRESFAGHPDGPAPPHLWPALTFATDAQSLLDGIDKLRSSHAG